jgi:hypothetical protein
MSLEMALKKIHAEIKDVSVKLLDVKKCAAESGRRELCNEVHYMYGVQMGLMKAAEIINQERIKND